MKNAEAKELLARKLRQIIDHWDGTTEAKLLGDALAVAVSAIDRATPKKVKKYEKICPCCGKSEPVPRRPRAVRPGTRKLGTRRRKDRGSIRRVLEQVSAETTQAGGLA